MLDDLRNSSVFIDDEEDDLNTPEQPSQPGRNRRAKKEPTFLGMTAVQRFLLSVMVFFMVCILGILALVATGSIVIPF